SLPLCQSTTPTIDPPVIHDDTSLIPTNTPTISPIASMIPPTAPTTHYTSPFIHTDSSDDDTPDTPPSPTHEIPPVEVAPPTGQILPAPFGVRRRRVTIISPGQPIPYGRLYRYHPNGPVYMMTAMKRVEPLPIHRLAVRHSVDYSSLDYFTLDDSSKDSPSDSSSETPFFFRCPIRFFIWSFIFGSFITSTTIGDHLILLLQVLLAVPYHICNDISPVPGALSSVRADLLPPRKRIRSFDYATDLEDCSDERIKSFVPRKTSLRDDVDVRGSDEPYSELDIDPEIQAEIDECIAYAHAIRAEGIDARVVIKTVAREEVEMSAMSTVEVKVYRVTHPVVSDDIPKPAQEEGAIEITYEMLGDLIDQGHRIVVTGQLSAVQSERISELKRDNTRLRGMLDVKRWKLARLLKPIAEGGDEQGGKNGDYYEGGNGGGDGNGNRNGRVNGNGKRGGNDNGNNNWEYGFEGICALTWWNTHKRTIGLDATYVMTWIELMKFYVIEVIATRISKFVRKMEDDVVNLDCERCVGLRTLLLYQEISRIGSVVY
ncbi:hypothetical protein Tco_0053834, partial [Tanacetum coccineum]